MSHQYRAVGWNPHKRAYDTIAAAVTALVLAIVAGGSAWRLPAITVETMILRATAVTALLLLHVILSIGPLCRFDRRLLPLLYNRRHLGVLMFLLAATHGGLAVAQFHAGGDASPLVSLLTSSTGWLTVARFPFHVPGAVALGILLVMAATSHDFWLRTLTAPVWRALHMGVYVAYFALVLHVGFGALQSEVPRWVAGLMGAGVAWLAALHTLAGRKEAVGDRPALPVPGTSWVDAGRVDDIPDRRARVICAGGERIAVFRYDGKVSAVSNVCQHQNGPLGEGRIVRDCIVCPWHGFEYRPDTGASPPPFTEAVPTFRVAVIDGRAYVDPQPFPPGTRVPPATVDQR
ncbi:MAG: ferric reductase-like transmembrane domain-containing protein [Acidobacteriota bacterium]|nr:ferric reductase-like transmembrane domain-containing protein [Acidobacteriota bacterium]